MARMTRTLGVLVFLLLAVLLVAGPAAAAPEGQMVWAVHISLALARSGDFQEGVGQLVGYPFRPR